MKYTYPVLFHFEDGGYWGEFPDFDGCFTQGDTQEAVYANAQEALEACIGLYLDENRELPKPTEITALNLQDGTFPSLVECTIRTKEKSVKKTLSIPLWLNEKAENAGINFSKVLQDALKKAIY